LCHFQIRAGQGLAIGQGRIVAQVKVVALADMGRKQTQLA
jgi:hypothetical protein